MADLINFVSKRVIDAKKEEKRKAREKVLKKAKEDYEREQRRKERRIESGESSWMLPSLSDRLTAEDESNDKDKLKRKKHKKEKKQKKDKKERKHKKQKKGVTEEKSSESESDDEWVEKGTNSSTTDTVKSLTVPSQPQQQRESWMLCPPITEHSWDPVTVDEDQEQEEKKEEEEDNMKALSCMDLPGQHPKELNPYWRDGGTGLPSERDTSLDATHREESARNSFSSTWLKRAYQRAEEEAELEGKSLADVVAKRYGSVERLEVMIKEAEEREAKQRQEESKFSSRERYRDDRDRRDDRKRDRDERRTKDRSPDRYDGHKARSRDTSSGGSYRSARDTEEHKWRRRDDERREQVKHDTTRFLRPGDSDNRSSFAGKFKRPPSSSSTVTSSTWNFDSKEESRPSVTHSSDRPSSRPSGGWRKKQETGNDKGSSPREKQDAGKESVGQEIKTESETDSSSSSEGEAEEKRTAVIPEKKITEKDLNDIGAKIVKAEIMGNEDLAIKLKSQLGELRKTKGLQEAAEVKRSGPGERAEEMVVLTRSDASGNVWPLEMTERQEPRGGRRKRKKVETHGKEGTRERYFADDDRYDLKEMVRREKMNTIDDQEAMMAKLASKAAKTGGYSDDFTLDDRFVSSAANKISPAEQEQRAKQRAIREHKMLAAQLSKCRFCFENPDIAKHLIIAIGLKVYLAVPLHVSLTEGHCLIIPMQHCSASTMLDEDVCSEIQIYKKGLTKMFEEMEEDVVFLETCKQLRKQHHMIIECVPLPKETGDMAPVYFKKAILESETEWAQNKKLIDTRKKGLRAAVPKGLPYFSVEFGLDGGFAHVIEEEELFPHYFGKEILGGMLDLEPHRWRKPRRENFEEHKRKVLRFADWWKPFDWTQRIERK